MAHRTPKSIVYALLCLLALSASAYGHQAVDDPLARTAVFNIEAQPLSNALIEFSREAGVQVLTPASRVQKLTTRGVHGRMTVSEALNELLEGTRLKYHLAGANTIGIDAQPKTHSDLSPAAARPASVEVPAAMAADEETGKRPTSSPPAIAQLNEVVVTAQKRAQPLQNVPISISVLSGRELDQVTFSGVSETLNTVPGVATQESYLGGGTVLAIRGVAPAFNFFSGTSPVAYYLDSVPFGLVKSAIAPDADTYDLARIEVLRGPQGTLYGASALNGVVRILTEDPDLDDFEFKTRVLDSDTQYGGDNYRADAAINVPIIDQKLAARAVLGYENNDGWIDQPDKKNANESALSTYRLKLRAKPIDDLVIDLSAWRSREDSGAPSVGYTFDKNASLLPQPLYTDFDAYAVHIVYELPAVTISSATSYLDFANRGTLGLDVPPFDTPGSLFFSGITSNVSSEEFNLTSNGLLDWRWSAGTMYRRGTENLTQWFTVLPVPTIRYYDTSSSYAVYGELTRLLFGGRLELTAGLRHYDDDISQEDQNAPATPFIPAQSTAIANTPRGVITWHLSQKEMIYASYSQGFRSGFPQNAVIPSGFAPARPDRLKNYEIGTKGTLLDGRLSYDASVYYMDWEGIQQQLGVQLYVSHTYYPAIVNGNAASGAGTDLALTYEPIPDLALAANASFNNLHMDSDVISNGEVLFRKGDRPTSSPETTAGLSAAYVRGVPETDLRARLSLSGNYISSQDYRGLEGTTVSVQSGDPMVFARASMAIEAPGRWSATLFGDNLNNERGSPVKAFIGAPNWDARVRPRTIGLEFQYWYQ